MKKLRIKTDKCQPDKNKFEVGIDDRYYDFIEKEFEKITDSTGTVKTKALISALIEKIIKEKNLEKDVDSLFKKLSTDITAHH
ncbi:MAG: hypothetical protein OIF32_06770 [Campylobacterales bacterium]|nr:hypothetical protein [Campylobacterales bacterium]